MKKMTRKRNDITLADGLDAAERKDRARKRYAHQTPRRAVALFEREVCELAQFLIDANLMLYPDAKAALVRCIDELLIANSSKKET